MSKHRERQAALAREQERRLAELRQLPDEALRRLPEVSGEDRVDVNGAEVRFTTHREQRPDGSVLVLVRHDRPIWLGLGTAVGTDGFVVHPDGRREPASDEDVDHFYE